MSIIIIVAALILLLALLYWQNNSIEVDEYAVESPALPPELDGCRIVQLSDLHNKRFGRDQKKLVEALEKLEPDMILITGDLIDKRRTKEDAWDNAMSLVRQAAELAPVFYVSGNHEWESGLYRKLCPQLETIGAEVLDNGFTILDHGDTAMCVMGLSDPAAFSKRVKTGELMKRDELPACVDKVRERLLWLCGQQEENTFLVLAAHRPQLLELYAEAGVHLVFCGHAHGGQVRLPGLGALYAPDQGFRPQYTEGPYIEGDTVMIVSRGLGNSVFPFRIFNRPHLVAVTLKASEEDSDQEPETELFSEAAGDFAAGQGEQGAFEEAVPAEGLADDAEETPEAAQATMNRGEPVLEELPEEPEEITVEAEEAAVETEEATGEPEEIAIEAEEAAVETEEATGEPEEITIEAEQAAVEPEEIAIEAEEDAVEPEKIALEAEQSAEEPEAIPIGAEAAETPEEPAEEDDEAAFERLQSGAFPAMNELPENETVEPEDVKV